MYKNKQSTTTPFHTEHMPPSTTRPDTHKKSTVPNLPKNTVVQQSKTQVNRITTPTLLGIVDFCHGYHWNLFECNPI